MVDDTWGGVVSGILTVSLPHPAISTIMSAAKNRTISSRGVRIFVPSWDCGDVRPNTSWLSALSRGHFSHLRATKLHNCFHSGYLPDRRKSGNRSPDCHGVAEVAGCRGSGPHPHGDQKTSFARLPSSPGGGESRHSTFTIVRGTECHAPSSIFNDRRLGVVAG